MLALCSTNIFMLLFYWILFVLLYKTYFNITITHMSMTRLTSTQRLHNRVSIILRFHNKLPTDDLKTVGKSEVLEIRSWLYPRLQITQAYRYSRRIWFVLLTPFFLYACNRYIYTLTKTSLLSHIQNIMGLTYFYKNKIM